MEAIAYIRFRVRLHKFTGYRQFYRAHQKWRNMSIVWNLQGQFMKHMAWLPCQERTIFAVEVPNISEISENMSYRLGRSLNITSDKVIVSVQRMQVNNLPSKTIRSLVLMEPFCHPVHMMRSSSLMYDTPICDYSQHVHRCCFSQRNVNSSWTYCRPMTKSSKRVTTARCSITYVPRGNRFIKAAETTVAHSSNVTYLLSMTSCLRRPCEIFPYSYTLVW